MLSSAVNVERAGRMSFVHLRRRTRSANAAAIVIMLLLFAAAAQAEMRGAPASASVSVATAQAVIAHAPVASALVTLPPEEKPKTHWPWWLRILAVIGVIVFIRLIGGSMRNNPGKPGPD